MGNTCADDMKNIQITNKELLSSTVNLETSKFYSSSKNIPIFYEFSTKDIDIVMKKNNEKMNEMLLT